MPKIWKLCERDNTIIKKEFCNKQFKINEEKQRVSQISWRIYTGNDLKRVF